ncbi:MAG TPA: amidase family protein, partial [Flavisolibacter sp.]
QNCDEFGMGSTNENSCYGPVLNPVNSAHVAGGSSGGSAAAVGAGLCMAALGTDTGGSVRLPASFCGVVGFKPGYGSVSRHGLIAYASSFDQVGILATRVDDVSRIYNVISGNDAFDGTCNTVAAPVAVQRPRIAWFPEWIEHPSVDPEIAAAMKQHLLELESRGFEVVPVSFPLTDYIVPAYYVLTTAEASSNLARFDGVRFGSAGPAEGKDLASFYKANRTAGFGKEVRRRIMLGTFVLSAGYFDAYYTKAQQVRAMLIRHMDALFAEYQFIIAPTSPTVAYKIQDNSLDQLALYMGDIFTVYASLVGIPAISLPVFKHSCNLPFGLQVLSSPHNEVSLQRFSHQLMLQ